MEYQSVLLRDTFCVHRIVSIHYFQYRSDFTFPGESHDFWELICVDRGQVAIVNGDQTLSLKKGELFFHKPNTFHNVLTDQKTSPSLVVIGFVCNSRAMQLFGEHPLKVSENEKELLARIILEARSTFEGPFNDPYQKQLLFQKSANLFASAQMIRLCLEQLLISLARNVQSDALAVKPSHLPLPDSDSKNPTFRRIMHYLQEHVTEHLSVRQICQDNLMSPSRLQKLFQNTTGGGVIDYFSRLKIEAASELIRDGQMNYSQIAERLGYSSVHYFSRQFKHLTTMSPSEYASSIRKLSEPKDLT